ncbi:MAG: serine protease [Thermoguttaceae bacterium]
MGNFPIATQWTVNATSALSGSVILSVVMVIVPSSGRKGTGWLVSDRHIITNEHVIRGGTVGTVIVQFSDGSAIPANGLLYDSLTDIAVLTLPNSVPYSPLKIDTSPMDIGTQVCTWGHPLGYNGPAPILSVGYLAGFNTHQPQGLSISQKRLVLNAALNPGNSGGPILAWGEQTVRGIAVSKHAPITPYLKSAIKVLNDNKYGVMYTSTDGQGNTHDFAESQIVAEILQYFREMTQVVIGEAIVPEDIIAFLDVYGIPWMRA